MEKNGEFKPEKETQAQKQHQEIIKVAGKTLVAKTPKEDRPFGTFTISEPKTKESK